MQFPATDKRADGGLFQARNQNAVPGLEIRTVPVGTVLSSDHRSNENSRSGRRAAVLVVRPALFAFRAKVVPRRTGPAVEHGMTSAARSAPKSRPASFRDLGHGAVGIAQRRGANRGAGGRGQSESQTSAEKDCPDHVLLLPVSMKPEPPQRESIREQMEIRPLFASRIGTTRSDQGQHPRFQEGPLKWKRAGNLARMNVNGGRIKGCRPAPLR